MTTMITMITMITTLKMIRNTILEASPCNVIKYYFESELLGIVRVGSKQIQYLDSDFFTSDRVIQSSLIY
ncbi:hypothetical protein pb186bvf_016672 [Paramecium bursaria]